MRKLLSSEITNISGGFRIWFLDYLFGTKPESVSETNHESMPTFTPAHEAVYMVTSNEPFKVYSTTDANAHITNFYF